VLRKAEELISSECTAAESRRRQAQFGVFYRTKQPDSGRSHLTSDRHHRFVLCSLLRAPLTRAYSSTVASYRSRTDQLCRSRLILARSIRSARPADGSACLLQYPRPGFSSTPMITAQYSFSNTLLTLAQIGPQDGLRKNGPAKIVRSLFLVVSFSLPSPFNLCYF